MTSNEQIKALISSNLTLLKTFGVYKVGLFGSYARNTATGKSDIDVLIDFEHGKENYDNFMAVCDLFDQMFKPYKVDVLTLNGLSPHIGPRILSEVQYV